MNFNKFYKNTMLSITLILFIAALFACLLQAFHLLQFGYNFGRVLAFFVWLITTWIAFGINIHVRKEKI